jgi:hypothetical protein
VNVDPSGKPKFCDIPPPVVACPLAIEPATAAWSKYCSV